LINESTNSSKLVSTLFLSFISFFVLMGYSFIRPIVDAMFIQKYGSQNLPYIWIATGIMIFISVVLYNRFVRGYKILTLVLYTSVISTIILSVLWLMLLLKVNHIETLCYVVKDIYIIFILEQVWTLASLVYNENTAKKYYGIMMAIATTGSFLGNLIEASIVKIFGSVHTLLFGLACMLIAIIIEIYIMSKPDVLGFKNETMEDWKESVSISKGFNIIFRKKYLLSIFLLVLLIQFVTAEIDLAFNGFVEKNIHLLDDKSQFFGYLNSSIDGLSLFFNLTITTALLKYFGIFFVLFGGPLIQMLWSFAFYIFPILAVITGLKIFNKSCDYSLYRAAKEMLYLPLSYEEKNKSKAIIDVMTYRIGKSIAAMFILIFKSIFAMNPDRLTITIIITAGIWILIVYMLRGEYGKIRDQIRD